MSTTASPSPNEFRWPKSQIAAVSLTFDDARLSQIDNGIPLLEKYGFPASFYISMRLADQRLEQWIAASRQGHEIGGHSLKHACSGNFRFARANPLEDYTLERMEHELAEADDIIERRLGVRPTTFAYPCGQTFVGRGIDSRSYVPLVAKAYLAGRSYYNESCNAPDFCDLARLSAFRFDTQPLDEILCLIGRAVEERAWIIFAGHEIGTEGPQNINLGKLEAVLKYLRAHNNDIWTDTVANIAAYIRDHRTL